VIRTESRTSFSSTPGKEASARRPISTSCVAKNLQFKRNATSRPPDPCSEVDIAFSLRWQVWIWSLSHRRRPTTATAEHVDIGDRKVFHGAADSRLQDLRNTYAMEAIMGGRACAKRSWASRAAVRAESRREQHFYRCVRLLKDDGLCCVCYADGSPGTMARFGR